MLVTAGLGKRYGSRWLFRNLSFQLERGDKLVVLGRNGSGKSTLLKVLAGLIAPTAGTVDAGGPLREVLGYAALDLALYPELTAPEHLELSAALRGCEANAESLLERVQLTVPRDLVAKRFSSGQRMRLKIALAIQHNPNVLILDEPTAGLDESGREFVRNLVQSFEGVVIFATNVPGEEALANYAIELD